MIPIRPSIILPWKNPDAEVPRRAALEQSGSAEVAWMNSKVVTPCRGLVMSPLPENPARAGPELRPPRRNLVDTGLWMGWLYPPILSLGFRHRGIWAKAPYLPAQGGWAMVGYHVIVRSSFGYAKALRLLNGTSRRSEREGKSRGSPCALDDPRFTWIFLQLCPLMHAPTRTILWGSFNTLFISGQGAQDFLRSEAVFASLPVSGVNALGSFDGRMHIRARTGMN